MNVTTEVILGHIENRGIEAGDAYATLNGWSNRVALVVRNVTRNKITLKRGTVIVTVSAANVVPPMLAPQLSMILDIPKNVPREKGTDNILGNAGMYSCQLNSKNSNRPLISDERSDKLFGKLNLEGLNNWPEDQQQKAVELLKEFHHLFALDDLDMGCTSQVKHKIKLTNPEPFKQRYRRIPPNQFQEVKKHLEEMLRVGAIQKSISPWASPVVLIRKKDGTLRFCINLWKLNTCTVRDPYSLPHIEESLDCLNGACIFTSLDLKSGYWQVLMDEDSIPLTAFTVSPLGFYECLRMPFRLTNAPATFQRLMESCLGDLHLQQCIIYLDDIIIFSKTPQEHLDQL